MTKPFSRFRLTTSAGLAWATLAAAQSIITTVAGTDTVFQDDGQRAVNAALGRMEGVAVDAKGSFYLTDFENRQAMRVDYRPASP
jgi:hypothetical protein